MSTTRLSRKSCVNPHTPGSYQSSVNKTTDEVSPFPSLPKKVFIFSNYFQTDRFETIWIWVRPDSPGNIQRKIFWVAILVAALQIKNFGLWSISFVFSRPKSKSWSVLEGFPFSLIKVLIFPHPKIWECKTWNLVIFIETYFKFPN